MPFFDEHPQFVPPPPPPSAQNDLVGECAFCGAVEDDVILGVCASCASPDLE
jgi:hypothetical protein